jgi:hypothetical protein
MLIPVMLQVAYVIYLPFYISGLAPQYKIILFATLVKRSAQPPHGISCMRRFIAYCLYLNSAAAELQLIYIEVP